jgi:uncharacterized membrane protein
MIELEDFVKTFTLSVASVVEGISAIVVAHAILKALFSYGRSSLSAKFSIDKLEIRLSLGKSLALALEFLLAADILRTAVAPNWDDIGQLAAIATLRTLLNYFLERELKQENQHS